MNRRFKSKSNKKKKGDLSASDNDNTMISINSLGEERSFSQIRQKQIDDDVFALKLEFFIDIIILAIIVTLIVLDMKAHPEGCGIQVREWVLIFFVVWLSKSTFNLFKINTLRNNYDKRLTFSMIFFAIANGILIIWLLVGYTFYYNSSNNCGATSLSVYNTVMLVILCIGYLVIFIYFLALCTVPCLYIWVQRKREDDLENEDDNKENGNAILKTLSKTKYDPLIYNHENECLICQ